MAADVNAVLDWLRAVPAAAGHHLQLDSRRVEVGDVFVAVPGALVDGRAYIAGAVAKGAAAVIAEAKDFDPPALSVPLLTVPGLAAQLGAIAAGWYGTPSVGITSVGVTGTNGKTSCSHWIAQGLSFTGTRCAVIGTVGSGFAGEPMHGATLTTPDAVSLQRDLRRLVDAGARAVAMEVSSIGLDQGRVNGMHYDIAVFTNLTRDHLDYHGSMAAYEAAKTRLFDWPTLKAAVVNLDDSMGLRLMQRLATRELKRIGYTLRDARADGLTLRLAAEDIRTQPLGLAFTLCVGERRLPIKVPLVGEFNVANLLAVSGALVAAGVAIDALPALLPRLTPPAGRMQREGGIDAPLAVIDYAHTPDAIVQALSALRPLAAARGGKLWIVFGAGGDRDPGKRAPMGSAAASGADHLVITSDNPRTESPAAIVDAVAAGVPAGVRCEQIVDRAQAIAHALLHATDADVVLIAGKGHEDYQEIHGVRQPFSDADHARAVLMRRGRGGAGSAH